MNYPNINTKKMGECLKAAREAKGLSTVKLSSLIDLSPRYINDIERGDKVPQVDTLVKMLNALGVSADQVLKDSLTVHLDIQICELQYILDGLPPKEQKRLLTIFKTLVEDARENN